MDENAEQACNDEYSSSCHNINLTQSGEDMFRRVKKWAAKVDNLLPKSKTTNVVCSITTAAGENLELRADRQETLLQFLRREGLEVSSYCGGMCSCGTCIVDIMGEQAVLSRITSREVAVLGFSNKDSSRLACQAKFTGEGRVHIHLRKPL